MTKVEGSRSGKAVASKIASEDGLSQEPNPCWVSCGRIAETDDRRRVTGTESRLTDS